MLPFQPPQLPNQIRAEGKTNTNSAPPKQVAVSNSIPFIANSNNSYFPIPCNNLNTQFSNVNGNFNNQYQLPLQNVHMGLPQPQFYPQNVMQNMNQFASCQPHGGQFFGNIPTGQFGFNQIPQNMNQITGLPFGQFLQNHIGFPPQVNPFNMPPCFNHAMGAAQGSQNIAPCMNPQLGMVNSQQVSYNTKDQNMFGPSTMGQNAVQGSPVTSQQLQRNSLSSLTSSPAQMQQSQNNLQSNNFGKSQGNHAKDNGSNISNFNQRNPQGNDFTRNQNESPKTESQNMRFQKSNFHPKAIAMGKFKPFKGKGNNDNRARKPHLTKYTEEKTSAQSSKSHALSYSEQEIQKWREERRKKHPSSSRPLTVNYSEQEVQQWREERRKNHPSRSIIEKKFGDKTEPGVIDGVAQKRRQQLKEILAKQAELGVEVAEIPKNYLLDSANQVQEREQNRTPTKKGRFQNKHGKRKRGGVNRFGKKGKLGDSGSSPIPVFDKKSPTLLQKLLSADIKRDKSHLLQALRFMVLNNFFVDWPKKPLEFPSVTLKGMGCGSEVERKPSPHQGEGFSSVTFDKDLVEECEEQNGQDISDEDVPDGTVAVNEETIYECVKETDCIKDNSDGEEGEITD